jgi:transposase
MARPKKSIDTALVEAAGRELEAIKDYKLSIRLQAIISMSNQPTATVAQVLGVSRQSLWKWVEKFRTHGIDGLKDRPKGHNPSTLTEKEKQQVAHWLAEGKNQRGRSVHWTIALLRQEVYDVFGKEVGKTPMWILIRKMGFRQKTPRPTHAKADLQEQDRFKKNRGNSLGFHKKEKP